MAQATILQAFAKILTNIQVSTSNEQLDTCERWIKTFNQYEDRKDFKQWLHVLNDAFLIRKLAINGELPIYDIEIVQIEDHPNNEQGH